jgi:hypothetical protein
MEFREFGKIARLNREICVTEKIDGTNAAVIIEIFSEHAPPFEKEVAKVGEFRLFAQSRTRLITPGDDNFGFAAWVRHNAAELTKLGIGHHFGEWWGSGIQRGYGLPKGEKRFSLFNVSRWADRHMMGGLTFTGDGMVGSLPAEGQVWAPICCHVVPVLYKGHFSMLEIQNAMFWLERKGSVAAPEFMDPEGVIVYHTAGNHYYKATIKKDDQPKGKA